jgi:hypothetical protein
MSHVIALLSSVEKLTGAENYSTWKNKMSDILTLLTADNYTFSALDICTEKWVIGGKTNPIAGTSLTTEQIAVNTEIDTQREERQTRTTKGLVSTRYEYAADLWKFLSDTYGTAEPLSIFALYSQTINFRISGTKEPSAEIANLELIYNQLHGCSVEIPTLVQAMTLLGSVPEHWKIASSFLAAKGGISDVTFQAVRAAILQEYNQHMTHSASQVNCFSGVKPGNFQRPQWQQNKGQQLQQQRPFQQRPNNGQQQQPMQNQLQQQQQRNSAGLQNKSRCGKKRPQQQVNELVASTGVQQLDNYTPQTLTLFAPATGQQLHSAFAAIARPALPHKVEPEVNARITHDPRPRLYPSRSNTIPGLILFLADNPTTFSFNPTE